MKLNPDCIRDILLTVEDTTDSYRSLEYDSKGEKLPKLAKYDHNEILYHMNQCNLSGFLVGFQRYDTGDFVRIADLSPQGHEFLANIRQDNIWNNTKSIASQIGSKSLETLVQISSNIITELIKAQFGLS